MFPGGYCGGLGVAGWLLMIGFWVAVLALAAWAVTRLFPTSGRRDEPPGPYGELDSLEWQLAAGEIDPDTYRRLREQRAPIGTP